MTDSALHKEYPCGCRAEWVGDPEGPLPGSTRIEACGPVHKALWDVLTPSD